MFVNTKKIIAYAINMYNLNWNKQLVVFNFFKTGLLEYAL